MIYDLQGNPLNAAGGNVLYGKKYVACGDSFTAPPSFSPTPSSTGTPRRWWTGGRTLTRRWAPPSTP